MIFYEEKGMAMCGLACVLCSREDCPGCKKRGCADVSGCSVFRCAEEKGLDGCYQCGKFPCDEKMLQGVRNRAFIQYARQFGKQALLDRLKENYSKGIVYHRPDGLLGDYDAPATEDDVMRLIQFGREDPYVKCPSYETEHFAIRLIAEEDAEDLFACYGDPQACRLFNSDNCTPFEFRFERMHELVRGWLDKDYAGGYYIRFSIIDKQTRKPVGTIETYDRKYHASQRTTGILRIDIASAYEKEGLLSELLTVAGNLFFNVFHVENIVMKAIPDAVERIAALRRNGYQPMEYEGREHYHILRHQPAPQAGLE